MTHTPINIVVRRAELDDAKAIATVHVRAWQAAYQGIVPSAFLNSLSIEQREASWREILERRTSRTWVAEGGGEVVGWISAGPSRDTDARATTGEVWAVYVSPEHWRRGVGGRLWREAEADLTAARFTDVTLWVLKANASAIAFYLSLGFANEPGREQMTAPGGTELCEIRLRKVLVG